jgi:hypothetical protein
MAKGKTATVEPPQTQASHDALVHEFDAWAEAQRHQNRGCGACSNTAVAETVEALLQAMIRKRAYKVSVNEIHRMIVERHPTTSVGTRTLERHLRECVRETYNRARGRVNG